MVTTVFEEKKKKVQLSKNKSVAIEALETTSMGELESASDTNINAPSPPPPPPFQEPMTRGAWPPRHTILKGIHHTSEGQTMSPKPV